MYNRHSSMDAKRRQSLFVQELLRQSRKSSLGRRKTVHVAVPRRGSTAPAPVRSTAGSSQRSTPSPGSAFLTPSPNRLGSFNFDPDTVYRPNTRRRVSVSVVAFQDSNPRRAARGPRLSDPFSDREPFRVILQEGTLFGSKSSLKAKFPGGRRGTMTRRPSKPFISLEEVCRRKKVLLAKFRRAVRLTIFCARKFKEHCLRINENHDELAPYIQRLHFHDDNESDDLLIDLSKFKANRQMRIPDETKRILSMELGKRTEQEIYQVVIALRNIKCFSDYPNRMQRKIAEVGLYEKYESKRMIVRQGHPASAFYFILSGAVVVMVMDEESNYARPVAHLYKGQTFGELAIINRTSRQSTVIAKETCEFLSISVQDYHKIFMSGGIKNVSDPDQEVFLKGLSCLAGWPIHLLQDHPKKCQFLFFKNADVITRDSHYSDWIVIIKSGSVQVLKKLKRVEAYEWKKKPSLPEPVRGKDRRELYIQRSVFRKVLPELRVPLAHVDNDDEESINRLDNGRPPPFTHPDGRTGEEGEKENTTPRKNKMPNLWPFHMDVSDVEYGRYLEDDFLSSIQKSLGSHGVHGSHKTDSTRPNAERRKMDRLAVPTGASQRDRSNSVIQEEESELLGYQPHIRTIMEDIDGGLKRKDDDEVNPADINPEFVHVQTLTKGQVFGLADLIIGDQPSFSLVSKGADILLVNKQFYMEHASEKLLRDLRQELCPYPSEEELQSRLQVSVDWQAYKRATLQRSLERMSLRRHMRMEASSPGCLEAY